MWPILFGVINFSQIVLIIVSLIASSDDEKTLKNLYWTKVYKGNGKIYWGLFSVLLDNGYISDGVYKYVDGSCDTNGCTNCGDAGQVVFAFSVITLLLVVASLVLCILRTFSSPKSPLFKTISVVLSASALLSSCLTIIDWGGQCEANLVNEYDDWTVTIGPGYGLAVGVVVLCLILLPLDIFLTTTESSPLDQPLNPSAPYISGGFDAAGVTSYHNHHAVTSAASCGGGVSKAPAHCSFCGKKGAREYPSHPEETTRFCSVCGKRHIVEEGLRYCTGCGTEIKF